MRFPTVVFSFVAIAVSIHAQDIVTFQYFYDDIGQLAKVVDSEGNIVEYVYDEVGNIVEIKRSVADTVAIFQFRPLEGGSQAHS